MAKVDPIPKGYHAVTPSIVVEGAAAALDFYKRALGAQEIGRMQTPDGKVMHAEFKVGDSIIMLADDFGRGARSPKALKGVTASLHLYVQDADAAFKRAVDAGATVIMAMADTFWGDRYGVVQDPFGQQWSFGTRRREVSQEEMEQAMASMMKQSP